MKAVITLLLSVCSDKKIAAKQVEGHLSLKEDRETVFKLKDPRFARFATDYKGSARHELSSTFQIDGLCVCKI